MSLSVYVSRSFLWPSSGSLISTFGTSPSRRKLRVDPSRHADDDEEVVDANEPAFDLLAGRLGDGDGHLAAAGPAAGRAAAAAAAAPTAAADPEILQLHRIATRVRDARPSHRSPNGTSCTSPRSTPFPRRRRRRRC